jgi:hypothetical protein
MSKYAKRVLFWLVFPIAAALMIALALLTAFFVCADAIFDEACHRFEAWCFDYRGR